MQTLFIDGGQYETPREFHLALQRLLHLPAHYGCNADALHDCLSSRTTPVNLWIYAWGNPEVAAALHKCQRVIRDLGGEVNA